MTRCPRQPTASCENGIVTDLAGTILKKRPSLSYPTWPPPARQSLKKASAFGPRVGRFRPKKGANSGAKGARNVMYHAAARLLLTTEKPPPLAMAVLDATVASVYRAVCEMIFMELDDEFRGFDDGEISSGPCWRELAIGAGREMGFEDVPSLDDRNFDDWDLLLDGLEVVQPPEGEPEPSQHAPEYGAEASPAELIALAADLGRRLRGAARPARVR